MLANYLKVPSKWHNELGSTMTLTIRDEIKGSFTGTYCSAVGNAENEYDLVGRFDTAGDTLGWVVSYQNELRNAHSTCAWSGHMELSHDKDQRPLLHTTWLLTTQTSDEDDWQATNVGFDTFSEIPPSKEEIIKALKRRQSSHPKSAFE